jgi:hypothetical protein
MNHQKVFNAVRNDYSEEVAIDVNIMLTILLTTKIRKSDIVKAGSYTKRVIDKGRNYLYNKSKEEFMEIWHIVEAVLEWNTLTEIQGIEECVPLSIKEIVAKNKKNYESNYESSY